MSRLALCCASLLLMSCAAHAAAVVTYSGHAAAKDWDPLDPKEQIFSGTTPDPAAYAALAGGNNAQSITGSGNGGSVYAMTNSVVVHSPLGLDISGQSGATTMLSYRVQLVGPDSPVVAPVRIVANGYIHSAGVAYGQVSLVVNYDAGGSSAQMLDGRTIYNTGSEVFSFDQVANFKVNAYFDVYLSVTTSAGGVGATGDGWSQAFLDPVFTIADPAQASLYHFEGVPGIAPSVPEPATWALAMLGLGVLLVVRRVGSEAESFSSVTEQRVKRWSIWAQSGAVARATASICNDERARFGVRSGHDGKTLSLSASQAADDGGTRALPNTSSSGSGRCTR